MEGSNDLEIGRTLILPQIRHIGVAAPDTPGLLDTMKKTLGIAEWTKLRPSYTNKRYQKEPEDFELEIYFGRTGSTTFEVIDSVCGRTPYREFFEKGGKGLHHVSYEIDDLDKWTRAYEIAGFAPILTGERPGLRFAYFDNGFFVIEMIQIMK